MGWIRGISMVVGTFLLPVVASAQSPLSVTVSPLLGASNFRGHVEVEASDIHLDAVTFVGLQTELAHGDLPIDLRLGAARTLGGDLRTRQGSRTTSCGPTCTRTEILYGSVGDAAVTSLWTHAVLRPFDWRLEPYVFVGVAHRWTSLSPASADVANAVGGSTGRTERVWGYGLELSVLGGRGLWVEATRVFGEADSPYWATGAAGWSDGPGGPSLTMGFEILSF